MGPDGPGQGRSGRAAAPSAAGHLHPPARRATPVRRPRPGPRSALRPRHPAQGPHPVPDFCRYLRSLYPPTVRIAIVCDNFSPHLSTRTDSRVGTWATVNNAEIAYTPFYGSWLNRIEPQFTALRYFTLDGTDHATHRDQARMIRRYIAWRNGHTTDPKLRKVIKRASTIKKAKVA